MEKKIGLKDIKNILQKSHVSVDSIGKNKAGNIIVRHGFFYSHGYDSKQYEEAICKVLSGESINPIKFEFVESGEHWAAFKGGASTANQSHWWVEIKLL